MSRGNVTIPRIDLSGTQSVTIALWTKRNYTTTGGSILFESGGVDHNANTGFALFPDDERCKGIQAALRGNEGTTANCYAQPSSGVWHHVAVVYDKRQTGGNGIAFYVDGLLQHPAWNLSSVTNTDDFANNPIFLFGTDGNSQASSGSISDLRIYKSALTGAQIQAIYNVRPNPPPSGLVAAYAFNEGAGSTVADLSGNGNTGTVSNASWTSAGKYGKALVFNGNSSLVRVKDSLPLHLTSAMTLEAWVNPTRNSYGAEVISKGNYEYSLGGISHYAKGPPNAPMLGRSTAGTLGFSELPLNVWTHLATTFDGAKVRFYVNGELISTEPHAGTIANSRAPLQIGGNNILGRFFTGIIDEVRIYQNALTQAQIQSDMDTPISASLISISVTSPSSTIDIGTSQQLTATGTYSDGSQHDLTAAVHWSSSNPPVIDISSIGMARALSAGSATLQASLGTIYSSGTISTRPGSFSISASPSSLTIAQGNQGTSTITTRISGHFNSAISLAATGAPSGTTVTFNPSTIPAPGSGSSTMTINVGASTPAGTYPITVIGSGGGLQQHTTVTLTVTGSGSFTISASPSALTVAQGNQGTSTITAVITNGFNSSISLSASGVPAGTTVSFNPVTIPAPGSGNSTMTVTVSSSTPTGTYPIAVTGSGGGIQQHATVTLTVTGVASFTISASPSALTIPQGNQGTSTITTAITNGFNSSISLSASGAPAGTTVSFNPATIPAPGSGNSTMTVTVGSSTPSGTYPITVTGTGGGIQQPTTVTLTVTGNGIALDGNVHGSHDNGQTTSTTATVSIGTPSAGDLITCEVTFDASNGNSFVSVSDNNNGAYTAAVPATLDSSLAQWFGIYYMQAVAGSPTTITLTTSQSRPWEAISCEAWKGVATSNALDSNFVQLQNAVGAPNPTTGSNKTPAGNGELIIASLGYYNTGTPAAGANYALIDGNASTRWYPEYWIQTIATSTAGNYTWPSDTWSDMMAAFRPSSGANFTISASPSSLTVAQGNQGTSTITTAISGGFNSSISLSASGVPVGTTVSFNPATIPAPGSGNSTMTLTVGSSTPVGTYPITVTGNGGGTQQTTVVTLTVTTSGQNFTLSASPVSLTILQGNQGTSTITTTISGGFNSSISLSVAGAPSGATITFNPITIPAPGAGSSTMTIVVGSTTHEGTYPLSVTATGGGIRQTITVTLTVTAQMALNWTASQSPGIAGYNIYRSATSGGPYTKINSALDPTTTYFDTAVQDGFTYYYVTTAVDNQGQESGYSNEASATLP